MSSTKFIAILPQPTQPGDKIQISGRISDHAEKFSINFANEVNENPQSITYSFNWDLANKMLIEDYKEDDEWKNRIETEFDTFDEPEFALEFAFQDDGIYVYLVSEDGRNLVTHYQPEIDFQFIESVQVCDDVEKVTQLTFSYN
uniref:Galectin n=1 Tax=Bactrocera dorsalis TaxID=27457 RepID=A0A034VUH8_BACDO